MSPLISHPWLETEAKAPQGRRPRHATPWHIAVPERAGHDDLAMSLCLAVHPEGGLVRPRSRLADRGSVVSAWRGFVAR